LGKRRIKSVIFRCLALSLVLAVAVTVTAAGYPEEEGRGDFIYTWGTDLMLRGKPFRYVGANTYYLMVYAASPELRIYVDEVFDSAEKMGLKVIRTWAFNDDPEGWNALQYSPGRYNKKTFIGLDYVIKSAKEHGIYLMLTLVNNWTNYGGAKQYVDWSPTAEKKEHDEFFSDKNARKYFKAHIKAVLTRVNRFTGLEYRNDPTIFAWELINEPRVEDEGSGAAFSDWLKEMSGYLKSIDSNHLLATGSEGFYSGVNDHDWKFNGSKGSDFIRDHSIDSVDLLTFHLWPRSDEYCLTPRECWWWIKMHVEDAKCLNKPLILEEYGEKRDRDGGTAERDKFYAFVLKTAEEEAVAGTNFWFLMHEDYKEHDDGYGVYYNNDRSTVDIIAAGSAKAGSY